MKKLFALGGLIGSVLMLAVFTASAPSIAGLLYRTIEPAVVSATTLFAVLITFFDAFLAIAGITGAAAALILIG
jgi:hypothetical protein